MAQSRILVATLALTLAPFATAQIPAGIVGYGVSSPSGGTGDRTNFDCTPRTMTTAVGSTLTFRVYAPLGNFYAIALSGTGATSCLSLPFLHNSVVIDPPWETLTLGVTTLGTTTLGWGEWMATLPPSLPPGTFWTQAAAIVPLPGGTTGLATSVAIATTVQ